MRTLLAALFLAPVLAAAADQAASKLEIKDEAGRTVVEVRAGKDGNPEIVLYDREGGERDKIQWSADAAGLATTPKGDGTWGAPTVVATPHPRAAIVVEAGDKSVMGSLDPAIIDAVIKRYTAQIQYCYERELAKKPALAGKIVVNFVIGADGFVTTASIKSSTMGDANVETCIADRFKKIRFPQPKGGGIVNVNYPFVFKSGTSP